MPIALFAAGWLGITPQFIGEIALITVGAVMLGFIVFKLWPKPLNPQLFAYLVPFSVVGGLAYLGSSAAAVALVLLAVVAALALFIGVAM